MRNTCREVRFPPRPAVGVEWTVREPKRRRGIALCRGTRSAFARFRSMENKPYSTPSEVTAEHGEVAVDGPDGVAVSLTPEAAAETSDRLLHAAAQAKGQLARKREEKERKLSSL